jgi:hypothetical protein
MGVHGLEQPARGHLGELLVVVAVALLVELPDHGHHLVHEFEAAGGGAGAGRVRLGRGGGPRPPKASLVVEREVGPGELAAQVGLASELGESPAGRLDVAQLGHRERGRVAHAAIARLQELAEGVHREAVMVRRRLHERPRDGDARGVRERAPQKRCDLVRRLLEQLGLDQAQAEAGGVTRGIAPHQLHQAAPDALLRLEQQERVRAAVAHEGGGRPQPLAQHGLGLVPELHRLIHQPHHLARARRDSMRSRRDRAWSATSCPPRARSRARTAASRRDDD